MKRSTELTLRSWILVVGYLVLIFGVSSIPQSQLSHVTFRVSDKLAHLAEYSGFGLLLTLAAQGSLRRTPRWLLMVIVVLVGAAIGALDETYQMTVPGRERELLDWIADVTGALIGTCVAVALGSWMTRHGASAGKPTQNRQVT